MGLNEKRERRERECERDKYKERERKEQKRFDDFLSVEKHGLHLNDVITGKKRERLLRRESRWKNGEEREEREEEGGDSSRSR